MTFDTIRQLPTQHTLDDRVKDVGCREAASQILSGGSCETISLEWVIDRYDDRKDSHYDR